MDKQMFLIPTENMAAPKPASIQGGELLGSSELPKDTFSFP